jgi:carbamoyltransferase
MRVLGVSGGHDANWSVVDDGRLLGAFEKERFSRRKHDVGDVRPYLEQTLASLRLQFDDIDLVATSEPVWEGTGPGTRLLRGRVYERADEWTWQTVDLHGRTFRCVSLPHHVAHAAYAFYTSGFDDACVITWDAGGEGIPGVYAATTVSSWRGNRLEWFARVPEADFGSLWSVYSRAIFGHEFSAGKLMGLAALGDDDLVEPMRERYLFEPGGELPGALAIRDCWAEVEAPVFHRPGATWQDRTSRNAAFAIQTLTTDAGLALARAAARLTGRRRLALGGGVSLNGYLCTKLRRDSGFDDVFVPPAVHDGGLAAGCALFALHHALETPRPPAGCGALDLIGAAYTRDDCAAAALRARMAPRALEREDALDAAASAIARGEIVGWYEGRSEHGPRALGARSILCGVGHAGIRNRLNDEIKFREPFRPVAPVVREQDATDYFELDWSSPYMMYIVPGRARAAAEAPAALHADGTARVQTVAADSSLGRIAARVGELTGTPLLINTSLNVREPIVETPAEAMAVFERVPLDALFLDGLVVERSPSLRAGPLTAA